MPSRARFTALVHTTRSRLSLAALWAKVRGRRGGQVDPRGRTSFSLAFEKVVDLRRLRRGLWPVKVIHRAGQESVALEGAVQLVLVAFAQLTTSRCKWTA
jgi:hypothetical protein